jgi:hypothetical protein
MVIAHKLFDSTIEEAVRMVTPLLDAARDAAVQYIKGSRTLFESVLEQMFSILNLVERAKGLKPSTTERDYTVDICSVPFE